MNTLNYDDWDIRISNRVWQSCDSDILAEWYIPNIWICTTVIKLISAFFNTIGISRVWVGRIKVKKACHTSTLLLYTDNTEMHSSLNNIDLAVYNVNKVLKSVRHWFCRNGPICNTKKLEAMIIAFHKALKTNWDINIFYRDSLLKQQRHFKNLGVAEDKSLSWNNHVSYVSLRVYPKLKLLNRVSSLAMLFLLKI